MDMGMLDDYSADPKLSLHDKTRIQVQVLVQLAIYIGRRTTTTYKRS